MLNGDAPKESGNVSQIRTEGIFPPPETINLLEKPTIQVVTSGKVTKLDQQQQKKQQNQNKKQQKQKQKHKQPRVPTSVPKKDHHQRVTYLYKLGNMMAFKQLQRELSNPNKASTDTLSRMYLNHMDLVSKKAVLKLHPDIKRTVCKNCSRLQIEGVTSTMRIDNTSKKELAHCDVLEHTCICGNAKRFPVGKDPSYTLFSEREDVLHEMAPRK